MEKVGIVIVTYNSGKFISTCLNSIKQTKYNNLLVVIIDNASTDNTVAVIKKHTIVTKLIQNLNNCGFAKANNQGIRFLLNENVPYILLLNPDTTVSPRIINELVEVFHANETVGIAGPIITYMHDSQKIWFAGGYFNQTFCFTKHPHMNESILNAHIVSGKTDFVTGASMMVHAKTFKKVGLLPEDYFLYFEDAFFCQKVNQAGMTCLLLAKPLVKHVVSASTGNAGFNTFSGQKAYYFARNPLLYIKRYVHGKQKVTNFLGQFIIRFPHYMKQFAREKNSVAFRSYFRGLKDGITG